MRTAIATLSVLASSLCFTACGQHSTGVSRVAEAPDPAVHDGQPIAAKLFYDFPLSEHKKTYVRRDGAPDDDGQSGWTYSVTESRYGGYVMEMFVDYNNYSYATYYLELNSGDLAIRAIHNAGYSLTAPARGGDKESYLQLLGELNEAFKAAKAPADVLNYLASVEQVVKSAPVSAIKALWEEKFLSKDQDEVFKVQYTAGAPFDILFKMSEDAYNSKVTPVFKRLTVQPGSGTAEFNVHIPAVDVVKVSVEIVPVGAADPKLEVARPNQRIYNVH